MPFKYSDALPAIAALVNDLAGETVALLDASYGTAPLVAASLKRPYWGLKEIQGATLDAVGDLALLIASTANHPARANFASRTAALTHRAQLPSVDTNSDPIVGVFGSICDNTTGRRCDGDKDVNAIERLVTGGASLYAGTYYYAVIEGQRVYHTLTSVRIDCCIFDYEAEKLKVVTAAETCPLPDAMKGALVAAAAFKLMGKEGALIDAAAPLGAYVSGISTLIQQGGMPLAA